MGFSCATGVLSVNTGAVTTNYSVTGVSPSDGTWKAVLLWWSGRADVADAAGEQDIQPGFGAAVSSTGRWTATGQSDHSPTTTATDRYQSDAACVAVLDINGAVVGLADFVPILAMQRLASSSYLPEPAFLMQLRLSAFNLIALFSAQ
jgi:hypothetical protein